MFFDAESARARVKHYEYSRVLQGLKYSQVLEEGLLAVGMPNFVRDINTKVEANGQGRENKRNGHVRETYYTWPQHVQRVPPSVKEASAKTGTLGLISQVVDTSYQSVRKYKGRFLWVSIKTLPVLRIIFRTVWYQISATWNWSFLAVSGQQCDIQYLAYSQ